MATKRATLKDVAERSGYALRTVKNVVAGKSSVGEPVREAVLRAMDELNYKQNSLASTLAKHQTFSIAVILPQIETSNQKKLIAGISRCAEHYEDYGLELEIHYTLPTVFAQVRLLEEFYEREDINGIILQPVSSSGLNAQIDLLVYNSKPVITLETDAPESKRNCFVGSDHIRSGRMAAQLMANYIGKSGAVLVPYQDEQSLRLEGFRTLLAEQYPDITLKSVLLSCEDATGADQLSQALQDSCVRGIFDSTNSLALSGQCLRDLHRKDIVLIGCTPTEDTIDLMRAGYIDILISQDSEQTGHTALDILFRYLSRSEYPPKQVYTPLAIVTSECL